MPKRKKLNIRAIRKHFDSLKTHVFRPGELHAVIRRNITNWGLPKSKTLAEYIERIFSETPLTRVDIKFPTSSVGRYIWKDPTVYEIASTVGRKVYFTHFSAMFLHDLTKQVPKMVYLNLEQTPKPKGRNLSQENIDRAFKNKQRVTKNVADIGDHRILLLSGKNTGNLGVRKIRGTQDEVLSVTEIERTLIDIAVRPVYSGGVQEVLIAYKNAKGKFSANRLAGMLKKMDYVYPYHQIIGFYLDKSGVYSENQLKLFSQMEMKFRFYLDYQLKNPSFSEKWNLFVPQGF